MKRQWALSKIVNYDLNRGHKNDPPLVHYAGVAGQATPALCGSENGGYRPPDPGTDPPVGCRDCLAIVKFFTS